MDRSFVVEAQSYGNLKDVIAVVFMNSEPGKSFLADLGLDGIKSVSEARPLSKQPTEPTMFVFQPNSGSVTATRFGWDGKIVNSETVHGQPSDLIPPISGQAADSLLYTPSAYIISGSVREGRSSRHVIGVLVSKPEPGNAQLKPDKKTLNRLGFQTINSVDPAGSVQWSESNTLYLFERVPSPSSLSVFRLDSNGAKVSEETLQCEPREAIPQVRGAAAEKYLYGSGLRASDFPKRASTLPPTSGGTEARKRQL